LPSNGGPSIKHAIRLEFHAQLALLWNQLPLSEHKWFLDRKRHECSIVEIDGVEFAPLVTSKLNLIARLSLLVLRPSQPGQLIGHGGDLDNRLKTLFDALTLPQLNQLPQGWKANLPASTPIFVLLEDDALVTELAVETDRLLDPTKASGDVDIVLDIATGVTRTSIANIALA
jgi:hypothetical protein